jgi:hypothetical protein
MQPGKGIVFCFGLPTTKEAYEQEIREPKKDFVQYFVNDRKNNRSPHDWEAYREHLVLPYKKLKEFSTYGFEFEDDCTSTRFREIVGPRDVQLIIFFSHCIQNGTQEECIEFFDRLAPSEDVFSWLPREVKRVYDFAVCNSLYLCNQAASTKKEYVIGTSQKPIKLGPWITIFSQTFTYIVLDGMNYITAFDKTVRDIRERVKKIKANRK